VLVDFSADWCANCKVLEAAVLHTEPVEQAIAASGAVTMYADYTRYPPEIEKTIRALRSNGVPVIAIFPGDRPYKPIVFRGGYTQDGLIEALEKATGRSLRAPSSAVAEALIARSSGWLGQRPRMARTSGALPSHAPVSLQSEMASLWLAIVPSRQPTRPSPSRSRPKCCSSVCRSRICICFTSRTSRSRSATRSPSVSVWDCCCEI
jgi:hypothetical protein